MRVRYLIPSALLALALTGCAMGDPMSEPTSSRPPFQTTTPGPVSPSAEPTGTSAAVSESRWAAIEADLAGRGVAAAPELVTAERVTFSDGSLGCPQPGQSYTQALVEGMRVIVTADGENYDYRFGRGDVPTLCTTP